MRRTQIYLTSTDASVLARAAKATRRTRSQLIRDAIQSCYGGAKTQRVQLEAIEASHGVWQRKFDGRTYVETLRGGRLAQLHKREG